MIIRKPYAFLIKNFKKIHIVMLILSLFVAYKLITVSSFVAEFMNLGIYDAYQNPISKYISFILLLGIILLVIGSAAILFLLRYKHKPWKLYLIPIVEYLALFFVLNMIKSFFGGYSNAIESTDLRMSRDLLVIFMLAQLPAIGIFGMRVFGLDIQKFNFNTDQEFFELSEEDREEIEISLNVDKHTFIRLFKRLLRNSKYFYLEHKKICRTIILILIIIFGFNIYNYFFVTKKSYSEGQLYNANGYTITINNSYYTNKDYKGNVISDKNNFVIVEFTVKNNAAPRKIVSDNFHLKNGVNDYISTVKTYAEEFKDLGDSYSRVKEVKRDEKVNFIIVYKVDKKLNKDRFVLYYQEDGNNLRKIKLKIEDLSKMNEKSDLKLGDSMELNIKNNKEIVSLDDYEISKTVSYKKYAVCNTTECYVEEDEYTAKKGYQVLKIEFGSNGYEGKDMIDFSIDYGKIVYIDNKNKEKAIDFEYPFEKRSNGKIIYTLVPDEVVKSEKLDIVYTVRNNKYVYKLK